MEVAESYHWKRKRLKRKDVTDEFIKYAIQNSNELRDKYWEDALNAIARVPPSGRLLKVVYKRISRIK